MNREDIKLQINFKRKSKHQRNGVRYIAEDSIFCLRKHLFLIKKKRKQGFCLIQCIKHMHYLFFLFEHHQNATKGSIKWYIFARPKIRKQYIKQQNVRI